MGVLLYVPNAEPTRKIFPRDGKNVHPQETPPMVHDLAIALVFLSMCIAPALVAMRADAGE